MYLSEKKTTCVFSFVELVKETTNFRHHQHRHDFPQFIFNQKEKKGPRIGKVVVHVHLPLQQLRLFLVYLVVFVVENIIVELRNSFGFITNWLN